MRKGLLAILLCLAFGLDVGAKLKVTTAADGTLVLTLAQQGDLNQEFSEESYSVFRATALLQPHLHAPKIKVVTAEGARMSVEDMERLCGRADAENNFPNLKYLDLEDAQLLNEESITRLHFVDKLKTVILPRSLTSIPQWCFTGYSCKIEHVVVPDNPERSVSVGTQAFGPTLRSIKLGDVAPNGNSRLEQQCFQNCKQLGLVQFGSGWKSIGVQAFYGCTALKALTLSEGVQHIEDGAFQGTAIEAIRLPNSLHEIRAGAFYCEHLKTITIPEGVKLIKAQAFQHCKALTDVYVLGNDTKAENQAFDIDAISRVNYVKPAAGGPVTRANFRRPGGAPLAMLHFPNAAKARYLNPALTALGGPTANVQGENGAFWPTKEAGKFTSCNGEYAGWHNFALTADHNVADETWTDSIRVQNKWYSLCFPFDMTEQQLKSAYGAEVRVMEFSEVKWAWENEKHKRKVVTLLFQKPVNETKAHHPYMIRPATRKVKVGESKNVIVGIKKQPESMASLEKVTQKADGVTYTFVGNYERNRHLQQRSFYYYSGDNESVYKNGFYWWAKDNAGVWTPYTACVLVSSDIGAGARAETVFLEAAGTDVLTDIEDVKAGTATTNNATMNKVFSLNGQQVGTIADLDALPKGIYLVNGRKLMVK